MHTCKHVRAGYKVPARACALDASGVAGIAGGLRGGTAAGDVASKGDSGGDLLPAYRAQGPAYTRRAQLAELKAAYTSSLWPHALVASGLVH